MFLKKIMHNHVNAYYLHFSKKIEVLSYNLWWNFKKWGWDGHILSITDKNSEVLCKSLSKFIWHKFVGHVQYDDGISIKPVKSSKSEYSVQS
jgi:hypothetical protein